MSEDALQKIIGEWVSDPRDRNCLRAFDNVSMEFMKDGQLIYTIHEPGKDQIMLLTYRIENGIIVSDQPSSPRGERTPFHFASGGRLVLMTDKGPMTCIRKQPSLLDRLLQLGR